jgi:hypothetical protein
MTQGDTPYPASTRSLINVIMEATHLVTVYAVLIEDDSIDPGGWKSLIGFPFSSNKFGEMSR